MFVLAHLSDPHLGPLPRPRLGELVGKRVVGFINWRRRRQIAHRAEILDAVIRDMAACRPDHVAVTGDLVNIALPGEFAPARSFLTQLGAPDYVTVVPGNHDAYVRATVAHAQHHWGDYMRGDAAGLEPQPERPARFPFVRRRGPVALIGVSTAVPTPPFMATGKLGRAQLDGLAERLARLRHEPVFRVVMIHHPPAPMRGDRWKRLTDARAFRQVLHEHGAELVLHGHSHVHSVVWLEGPNGKIPAVGVPSASASASDEGERAGYHLYRIDGEPGAWRCEMVVRGFAPADGGIVELGRQPLAGAQ